MVLTAGEGERGMESGSCMTCRASNMALVSCFLFFKKVPEANVLMLEMLRLDGRFSL